MEIKALSGAIAALGVLAGSTGSAYAAKFATAFSVDITEGDFLVGETFSGQVTYDDSQLNGMGTELVDINTGLDSLIFNFVGPDLTTPATYTAADDATGNGFPTAIFEDGMLAGLNYSAEVSSDIAFQFLEEPFGSGEYVFFTDDFSTFAFNTGTVSFAAPKPVPEPGLALGLVAVCGLAARRKR